MWTTPPRPLAALCAGVCLTPLALLGPTDRARAQSSPPPATSPSTVLEQVIVTAEKRTTDLQKAPLAITSLGAILIIYIGIQPPNNILISYVIGIVVVLALLWFLLERKRFQGPPIGDQVAKRQAAIRAEEMEINALGGPLAQHEAD